MRQAELLKKQKFKGINKLILIFVGFYVIYEKK